jgi:hypothetical protein
MAEIRITHLLFCWTSGELKYYSLRPVNNPKNSVDTRKYASYSGRNERVQLLKKEYGRKVKILRDTNPKNYLRRK